MEIEIINNNTQVAFRKKLWHETEIILAKCFNFTVDIDNGIITCDLHLTSKKSLYEFIKLGFKSFSESFDREQERTFFYEQIDFIYNNIFTYADSYSKIALPYYDKLYVHQREVIAESFYKKYNFLALDMGLGKTLTSASISRVHQIPLTVIICPSAVKWNWMHDLIKFGFNDLYFTMFDASKRRTFRAFQERFIILNYDIVDKFSKEILTKNVGAFIFDEAHALKNHLSGRAKNVTKLVEAFPEARITFLSGTPAKNRINDIFSYLKMIGHELGHSHKKFLDNFTIISGSRGGDRVTGGKNLQDLHIKLSNFMIRRTKEECLDLPDKIYLNYKFELDDYREEYNKVIEELSQQKSISSLTGNIHSLNIITAKAKQKGIIELAETIIAEGRKVVIFGGYKDPLNSLQEHFGDKCVKIDGSVESFMRNELVNQFINDPECMVFLGNWVAAGVGINLVNASDIIVQSFPLTPAELFQGIDRLHRIGQSKSVNVHYTFCEDSIDEYIHDIIIDKEKDINAVIDQGKEVVLRENMTEILMKKLLKRDDIVFENHVPAHKSVVAEEKMEEKPEQGIQELQPQPIRNEVGQGDAVSRSTGEIDTVKSIATTESIVPKYYLVSHPESSCLFICNEEEVKDTLSKEGLCEVVFDDVDVTKVISKGYHLQQKSTRSFNSKYTPNPVSIDGGKSTLIANPMFSEEHFPSKLSKFEQAIKETADKENIFAKKLREDAPINPSFTLPIFTPPNFL